MQIVRITAVLQDDGEADEINKLVLLCGVNQSDMITPGEWLGYVQDETIIHPFILKDESIMFFGGEEKYSEQINIGHDAIKVGRLIAISSPQGDKNSWAEIYEIIDCLAYPN